MKSRKWKWNGKWNGKWKQKLEKEIRNGNGNFKMCHHWRRALKIGSDYASCLLCMHEVMIVSFPHAHQLCSLAINTLVMCMPWIT